MGFFSLLLTLTAIRQLLAFWDTPLPWTLVADLRSTELPGLLVSIMALLSVIFLGRLLTEHSSAEERLNEAQRISQTGCWERDPQTDRISWSDEIYRILNLEPGDVAAGYELFVTLIHPDDRKYVLQQYACAIEQGTPLDISYRLLFKDEQVKYVRERCYSILKESGESVKVIGVLQDITEQKQAATKLKRNEAIFRSVFEQAAVGVSLVDVKSKEFVRVNSFYHDVLGYSEQEFFALTFTELTHVDDVEENLRGMKGLDSGEIKVFKMDKRYYHKNGSIVWATLTTSVVRSTSNEPVYYLAIIQDITERKQSELELKKLSRCIEASSSGVTITDPDGIVEYVNPKFTEITGYSKEEVVGKNIRLVNSEERSEDDNIELRNIIQAGGVWKGELQDRRKDGSLFWDRVSLTAVKDEKGVVTHVIGHQEDVTPEYELREQLSYQASHDALTGLVNRREFERRIERSLCAVRQERSEHAMCYMDLDQFKVVNDTYGHTAGDEMLRQLAHILQQVVRKRDTLSRLGGDEFGVLIEDCSSKDAHLVASNLQRAIQDFQFAWQDQHFKVGVSIGLVPIDGSISSVTELLRHADAACYIAKDLGRNRIHAYHGKDVSLAKRHGEMQWVTRIHKALEENRFCLFAQAIVALDSRQDKHYELLLRMQDEDDCLVPPGAFLPAAERYNLIDRLDSWVIKTAFTALANHPVFLGQINFISINLSGQSLTNPDFLNLVILELENSGIEPNKVCFEITETTAISNLSKASGFIKKLKKLGCQFALDDFGSGLSSFAYLKNLSVDYLKIDGMFVKDIVDDPIDYAMVKSINEIGHVMGMKTIAEFVENDEIKGMLKKIGVNYAQGYGVSKPSSFNDLLAQSSNVINLSRVNGTPGFK